MKSIGSQLHTPWRTHAPVKPLSRHITSDPTHSLNVREKLGAHDRTDLVKYAIKVGLINPE